MEDLRRMPVLPNPLPRRVLLEILNNNPNCAHQIQLLNEIYAKTDGLKDDNPQMRVLDDPDVLEVVRSTTLRNLRFYRAILQEFDSSDRLFSETDVSFEEQRLNVQAAVIQNAGTTYHLVQNACQVLASVRKHVVEQFSSGPQINEPLVYAISMPFPVDFDGELPQFRFYGGNARTRPYEGTFPDGSDIVNFAAYEEYEQFGRDLESMKNAYHEQFGMEPFTFSANWSYRDIMRAALHVHDKDIAVRAADRIVDICALLEKFHLWKYKLWSDRILEKAAELRQQQAGFIRH